MSPYKSLLIAAVILFGAFTMRAADSSVLSEVRFAARSNAEKNAGVWIDGQYLGYVKELTGDKKILLLPGKHEIIARQAWYQDHVEQATLEPGQIYIIRLAMQKDGRKPSPAATGELKLSVNPDRAAVFVDNQFLGHVNEFQGIGKAMLLTPGKHQVRLALPGYLPFETVVDLHANQKMKLETDLVKGSITEAGALVSQK
ncbi:MAG: hypothetical protein DMG90_04500 [Acidobacteria bacterium]|nr:MAG: hypothetical protein DMG90_04500 [Acidobacteriota bacterium]